MNPANTTEEVITDNKLVIYQMLVRLFGNKNTTNKYYGSKEENGVGKFNDITDKALDELKKLGASHIWYTGVIKHATMTDYTSFGIKYDDPDIVKGRAGSPYAVKDYYDVDPDLAVDVKNRMGEYEALIKRTHAHGLKVIMDFVPNHVARTYNSDARPAGVKDFGQNDDNTKAFSPTNDYYYIPSQPFIVPNGVDAGGSNFHHPLKDGKFDENPAKATGNDVFAAQPSINDWYETIKLNYGVDYQNGKKTYFNPTPQVWIKMKDILTFWAKKNVDGFRCDVAEMVPVEFWNWVIPEVKKVNPKIVFIGEAYNPAQFNNYFTIGKFDFLYDKVGLYDALKRLVKDEPNANVKDITHVWKEESRGFSSRMLRFLENHDEERIASEAFAKDAKFAKPAMVVSATLASGPVMLYSGQEVGEPGGGKAGFANENNRTTIFDYWGVPNHQKWMNNGKFDGAALSVEQKELRDFYSKLLNITATNRAIRSGRFYELNISGFSNKNYAYIRYTPNQRVLVIANFDRSKPIETRLILPPELRKMLELKISESYTFTDLLKGGPYQAKNLDEGIQIKVAPFEALMLGF
ncbi:alpha-amylase [Segetibacter aerophilus]|uniref:Alpha-amylase n=2 Tax=Segetibacter aerophilus TaxID=670293 RepID=A0A512BH56_9BACT|nr:alpha-amylase [Segetibacter aerophilus]